MPQSVYIVLQSITFILFLAAAVSVARAPNGRLLALGLVLLGVESALWVLLNALVSSGALRFESGYQTVANLNRGISLLGMLVLVAGARRLGGGSAGAPLGVAQSRRTYVHPTQTTMESLIIPRNATNSFTRAEALRDKLYERIDRACQRAGLQVIGYKSPNQSGTVWLRFDYLLPQDTANLSLRASLSVTIERFDYHRFEHLYTFEVTQGTKSRSGFGFMELNDRDLDALNRYVSAGGNFPSLTSQRTRTWPLQLWRPRNKVDRLRPDWLTLAAMIAIIAVFPIPLAGPLLTIAGAYLLWRFNRTRRTYILTTGKPLHDPRDLVRMDSWQTTIDELAPRHDEIRETLTERLSSSADTGIQIQREQIWYRGVDGKVEREQVVCTFRRALAFLHFEPYGNDLYVGWDSHVNCGTWVEQTLARGVDRESGKLVVANRVVPGWQAPNEYDITDVNYLTEWLHAAMVRVVKLKMAEHRIDQEIDFTIQRESRKQALAAEEPAAAPTKGGLGGLTSRLRRVA